MITIKQTLLLFFTLLTIPFFGQTTVFQESFETGNSGTPSGTCNVSGTNFFTRTDGSDLDPSYVVTGMDGTYFFAAQEYAYFLGCNLVEPTLTFTGVDISGYTNMTFAMLVAEDDTINGESWDPDSEMLVEINIDGGGYTNVLQFSASNPVSGNSEPGLDTNFDGTGDGTRLSSVFQEFTAAIGNGTTADIRITCSNLTGSDEDISFDNIRIIENYAVPPTPTISVTAPTDSSMFVPGASSVNVEFSTANLSGGETVDIEVNGVLTTGIISPFSVPTTDGEAYNITLYLMSGTTVLDFEGIDFSVANLTTVADVAALRADVIANGLEKFYEITNALLVTNVDGDKQWIQDNNIAGILINDPTSIGATYAVGDMVSGLKGSTAESNGVLIFTPFEDAGVIDSSGNTVAPQTITIPVFNADFEDYESESIEFQNVTFVEGDGVAIFNINTDYTLSDGANTVVKRTDLIFADYIGDIIPSTEITSVKGVASEFNGTPQILVYSMSSETLSINEVEVSQFSVYPNPASTGFVNIASVSTDVITVNIFDVLGKQVLNSKLHNNTLNISSLKTGLYFMKISQNNITITKKLMIK